MASSDSATTPSSPPSPPSPSNSENSAPESKPLAPLKNQDVAANEEKPPSVDPFEDMNSKEYTERFSKYEADYTRRLMAKYFSDKDIYGGNIFDYSVTINGEAIKASRMHCAQSYADPVQFLKEKGTSSSTSLAENTKNISNGKLPVKDE